MKMESVPHPKLLHTYVRPQGGVMDQILLHWELTQFTLSTSGTTDMQIA